MADLKRSQVDLNTLSWFLNSLETEQEYLVMIPKKGHLVYHYTDLNALSGIVGTHDLYLTNSQYSNDEDEARHGYEIACSIVERYLRSLKRLIPCDNVKINYVETLHSLLETPPPEGFYICCFCEKDNLLSQWRSYGANGTGVSLAFDIKRFIEITGTDMPLGLMSLWKVFYQKRSKERIVKKAIEFIWNNRQGGLEPEILAHRAADAIQFFVPTFKNYDFREEREFRLIFTPHPLCSVKPHYRVGRGMLIPYYSIKDLANATGKGTEKDPWPLPIQSVMVGPSAQKELNVESATMLLRQNDYKEVEVKASKIPYRG